MALDRNLFFAKFKLKTEVVELDGENVIVSELGGADYIKLWSDPKNQKDGTIDMSRFTPALITYAVVDEMGKRIFDDCDADFVARLPQTEFLKIAEVARKLNGLSGEDSGKNDSAVTSTDSTSGESQSDLVSDIQTS